MISRWRKNRHDPAEHEREIQFLSEKSGVSPAEVRTLFVSEFERLGAGAKVSSYLAVLTESSVRGMLRRKAASAETQR